MKTIFSIDNRIISVKYETDDYLLNDNETLTDLRDFCKPKIVHNEVIEMATPEELAKFQQAKQQEQFDDFMEKKLQDGQTYYTEKSKQITMQLFGRPQSEVNQIIIEIDASITPILDKVNTGDWYSAMIMPTPTPTIAEVQNILNQVKSDIQSYVKENYHSNN